MYCKNCGAQLNDQDTYCAQCGTSQSMQNQITNTKSSHWLWGVLGFIIPIAGLILFIVWKNSKPKVAKYVGIGALISVIINFILMIFLEAYLQLLL